MDEVLVTVLNSFGGSVHPFDVASELCLMFLASSFQYDRMTHAAAR